MRAGLPERLPARPRGSRRARWAAAGRRRLLAGGGAGLLALLLLLAVGGLRSREPTSQPPERTRLSAGDPTADRAPTAPRDLARAASPARRPGSSSGPARPARGAGENQATGDAAEIAWGAGWDRALEEYLAQRGAGLPGEPALSGGEFLASRLLSDGLSADPEQRRDVLREDLRELVEQRLAPEADALLDRAAVSPEQLEGLRRRMSRAEAPSEPGIHIWSRGETP